MQIMETGIPTVIALNMMDEVASSGTTINSEKLSDMFGVDVVPVIARSGSGMDALMAAVEKTVTSHATPKHLDVYTTIANAAKNASADDAEEEQANLRYDVIGEVVKNAVHKDASVLRTHLSTTDKIDSVLTSRFFALPLFAVIMYFLFACTFSENFLFIPNFPSPGVWLSGVVETAWQFLTEALAGIIESGGAAAWAHSLVIDGIMAGLGAVIGFMPLVLVLFMLMSILEDCGYMARVAFVMDRIFRRFGLSGRSFIPLLMGFGCSVPALMATRTLESDKDRKITIMITSFMSCGAKLPIYLMFVSTLFTHSNQTRIIFSIYVLGMFVAVLAALFLNKVVFKSSESNFIMELPPYRLPTLRSVGIHSWEKVRGFAVKAGTIIFCATVIIWLLSNFNLGGMCDMEESFLAAIGRVLKWIFYPLGFGTDWRPAVGIITGWIAKENIVATFAQLFAHISDKEALEALLSGEATLPAIADVFTKVSAYAYMAFNLFCMPCFAAVGAIKREMKTLKWTLAAVGFQMTTAYIVALIINVAGSLIAGHAIFN
jgi:ferrous iron transport protein B